MHQITQHTDLLLLDFDGTFYQFTNAFLDHCNEASAKTALALGVKLSYDEALKIALTSYETFGTSSRLFCDTYDIKIETWHEAYHQELEHHFIETSQVTAHELQNWPTPIALLSHSNRYWISNMLVKFGLNNIIKPEQIFALEDVNYNYKTTSESAYRLVTEKLGVDPKRSIMVEDSAKNLHAAKTLGMTTVYVTQGKAFELKQHPYIDHCFTHLPEFFAACQNSV